MPEDLHIDSPDANRGDDIHGWAQYRRLVIMQLEYMTNTMSQHASLIEQLKTNHAECLDEINNLKISLNTITTKIQVWGTILGIIGTILGPAVSILLHFLK